MRPPIHKPLPQGYIHPWQYFNQIVFARNNHGFLLLTSARPSYKIALNNFLSYSNRFTSDIPIQQKHKQQLSDKSALFVAIWMKNIKHFLCSNQRLSGRQVAESLFGVFIFKGTHVFAPLGFWLLFCGKKVIIPSPQ